MRGHGLSSSASPIHRPLHECLTPGRLIELSGTHHSTRTTAAVRLLRAVQAEGETAVWIQPEGGPLFPPDLTEHGIDLDALVVLHIPRTRGHSSPYQACKAAEILLRSGAFGLVILDFVDGAPPQGTGAWQGRLLGLARQHHARVVMLTHKPRDADSLGTLISIRLEPQRIPLPSPSGHQYLRYFELRYDVIKNKSGAPMRISSEQARGPWGFF